MIVAALVPRLGSHPYAAWLREQQIQQTHHAAGVHLRCTDFAPQLAPDPSSADTPTVLVNPTLIVTGANGDDRAYRGPVSVAVVGPDGMPVETQTGVTDDGSLFTLGTVPVPAPGAYRFTVGAQNGTGAPTTDACWAIAGVPSAGRLLVIGKPGSSVAATFTGRDVVSGSLTQSSASETVAADGIAVFEGVAPGLADVGLSGAAPTKLVPVGERGAIVALVPATSMPGATN